MAAYYLGRGKTEQAKSRAESCRVGTYNASYRLLLAQAEERLNNVIAAETHLRMAHKLEPNRLILTLTGSLIVVPCKKSGWSVLSG